MLFIDNQNITDPRINLALEEYIVRNFEAEQDYILFYINQPSLIIGKHQNTIEEINQEYVKQKGIIVVRRISGGGTVYHDLGNLNFSFLTKYDSSKVNNFAHFTQPIVEALRRLGVPAEMTGRNDIVAEGRKISGNAQFSTMHKMFSHGTLLFNSEIDEIVNALQVKADKIESKGIKSVRSRVANISEFLKQPMTMQEFKNYLLESIFQTTIDKIPQRIITDEEWKAIHRLSAEKYQTWEWNYGRSPEFNIQRVHRFDFGQIDARIHVKDGLITQIKFYGDFLSYADLSEIENLLLNARYEQETIKLLLQKVDLNHYFGKITTEEFASFLVD
ncbi:MAG: lipoate--protein ligase [Microscillaceae bacterium]|nr:lipoate--protein ligase [Microscillaceae bacterium]MDW8461027.1 lipoate--protein ligase [Cytophagales bacterium]